MQVYLQTSVKRKRSPNQLYWQSCTNYQIKFTKPTEFMILCRLLPNKPSTNKNTTHQEIILIRAVRLGVKLYNALPPACCLFSRRRCPYSVGLQGNSKSKCQQKSLIFLFILENVRMLLYITLIFDVWPTLFVLLLGFFWSSL